MTKTWTVEERAAEVVKNYPALLELAPVPRRQLQEIIYTMSEAGHIEDMPPEHAVKIWQIVELVRQGRYTEDMRT